MKLLEFLWVLWVLCLGSLLAGLPQVEAASASVAASFPAKQQSNLISQLSQSHPAIFRFTTSADDRYERFQVEVRVTFKDHSTFGQMATLVGAPAQTCHDLIAEASEVFPSPLNCHSGDFASTSQRYFGIRFSAERPLRMSSTYAFVVPRLRFLQGGGAAAGAGNFTWLFEFLLSTGEAIENATAILASDVKGAPSDTGQEKVKGLTGFLVKGGTDVLQGSRHQLEFVFDLTTFPESGVLVITFLPMLLWDQETASCFIETGSFPSRCEYRRVDSALSYNQLHIIPTDITKAVGGLSFYVKVLIPSGYGFLPTELIAHIYDNTTAFGPFYDGDGNAPRPPIEMHSRFAPSATVMSVLDPMEGRTENAVTITIRPKATLRGYTLRGEELDGSISITVSTFFVVTGASNIQGGATLGTDLTPFFVLSSDKRTATFSFKGKRALALRALEYKVQIFVTNPLRYFWAVTAAEPWHVTASLGPRPGCSGCPYVSYSGDFVGPPVYFFIGNFQALPGLRVVQTYNEVVFLFRLIYITQQIQLMYPSTYTAKSCHFHSPADLDARLLAFLLCSVQPSTNTVKIFSKPPGGGFEPLPRGPTLGFRLVLANPATPEQASGSWGVQALDGSGTIIGTTSESDVTLALYKKKMAKFMVLPRDRSPEVVSIVNVQFTLDGTLAPGDFIQVTAPPTFAWKFTASEFSAQPEELGVAESLPVYTPSRDGTSNVLELQLTGTIRAGISFGFRAAIRHPSEPPVDYRWSIAVYGLNAPADPQQRYEVASLEAYELSILSNINLVPWTRIGGRSGPITVAFRTMQAVPVGGSIILQCDPAFRFSDTCGVSSMLIGGETFFKGAMIVPATAVLCQIITRNELHLILTNEDPQGFRGLAARQRYAFTIHSVQNAVSKGSGSTLPRWQIRTRGEKQSPLDSASNVRGYTVSYVLPFAALVAGGPSSGADSRAGVTQWVTIALQVYRPTRPQQDLQIFASPGFEFATFCIVRDPPAGSVDVEGILVADQLTHCSGLHSKAMLSIAAVWPRRMTFVFQIEVKNAMPGVERPPVLDVPYLKRWRVCLDNCNQMHVDLQPVPLQTFRHVHLLTTSRVIGNYGILVVRFSLANSAPPGGELRVRAPNGFVFPLFCDDYSSTSGGGYSSVPWKTRCEGGAASAVTGSGRRLFISGSDSRFSECPWHTICNRTNSSSEPRALQAAGTLAPLLPSEVRLILGPQQGDRLLASKPYVFAVGVHNPPRDAQPVDLSWVLRTGSEAGMLVDYAGTSSYTSATGALLLPLIGAELQYSSQFAGVDHAVEVRFRFARDDEGGDADAIPFVRRLELHAPVDLGEANQESTEWDLYSPSACTSSFSWGGEDYVGFWHANTTTQDGVAVCRAAPRALTLTFEPSVISSTAVARLRFLVRNPSRAPPSLWNRWTVRLLRIRPSVAEEVANRDVTLLASQGDLFEEVAEGNIKGFPIVQEFASVEINPSGYAVNETTMIVFKIAPRASAERGAVLKIAAPDGFVFLRGSEGIDALANSDRNADLTLQTSGTLLPSEAEIVFGSPFQGGGDELRFALAARSPEEPMKEAPLWNFDLRASDEVDAEVLERTFGHPGYDVYRRIKVAGLFGSLREVGSRFNFVRLTFTLPIALPQASWLRAVAPPGYVLLAEGFSRDNLPPFSAPPDAGAKRASAINISIPQGLDEGVFYAFRLAVENPEVNPTGDDVIPWELWGYAPDGSVMASNRKIPPFELQARFNVAEVLPSSIVPLREKNIVEVQVVLDSSPMPIIRTSTVHDKGFFFLELPEAYILAPGEPCHLNLATLSPSIDVAISTERQLSPFPSGSTCKRMSDQLLAIEVHKSLHLGKVYHFAMELANPLETPTDNSWSVSTERNGLQLHLALDLPNYQVARVTGLEMVPTDPRLGVVQLIRVQVKASRHVRGSSTVEVQPPAGFVLACEQNGVASSLAMMPEGAECQKRGDAAWIVLPSPVRYAPYLPTLVADSTYGFAVYCRNPVDPDSVSAIASTLTDDFSVRFSVQWPTPRLLGLRADIPAPDLAPSLPSFAVEQTSGVPGVMHSMIVRFGVPRAEGSVNVQAILLSAPPEIKLGGGRKGEACGNYTSQPIKEGDSVLPPSVCTTLTASSVIIQIPEPLPLAAEGSSERTYVFQLEAKNPEVTILVDTFTLSLLPGPGAYPLYIAAAEGFSRQIAGLKPLEPPSMPGQYMASPPGDSSIPPRVKWETPAAWADSRNRPTRLVLLGCGIAGLMSIS